MIADSKAHAVEVVAADCCSLAVAATELLSTTNKQTQQESWKLKELKITKTKEEYSLK